MEFPHTRSVIEQLPGWINQLAATFPPPVRVDVPGHGFRWQHEAKTGEVVLLAKAVRVASGLRAALLLADLRHTTECCTVLRTVSDFASEILFVGEGLIEERLTEEQQRFVNQHFETMPLTAEELAEREREYYVGRTAIRKAHARLAEKAGLPKERMQLLSEYLSKGYDRYVHGNYGPSMELYAGRTNAFMLKGSQAPRQLCAVLTAVAGKLGEALSALRFVALIRNLPKLEEQIRSAEQTINNCGEVTGKPCEAL